MNNGSSYRPPPRWAMRLGWRLHKLAWRLSGGRLARRIMGMPVIEVVTTGRRSGQPRAILISAVPHGEGWAIAGTNAGIEKDPAWVHNLRAIPAAEVRTGANSTPVRARFLEGAEHASVWDQFKAADESYRGYDAMLDRHIPIVALEPV